MSKFRWITVVLFSASLALSAQAPARLPIKEIAAFKDGHAFVLCAGEVPVDANGDVVFDDLPEPLMGTFWPSVEGEGVKLCSATASLTRQKIARTAITTRELLEANVGAEVTIIEPSTRETISGVVVDVPARSAEERAALDGDALQLAEKGALLALKTSSGVRYFDIGRVTDLTFHTPVKKTLAQDEVRRRLTLRVSGVPAGQAAKVGYSWVEEGVRWVPAYRIVTDGDGRAKIAMEATIVNDLADFENATVHLVIGVPHFAMKGTVDPLSLISTAATVSARVRSSAFETRSQLSNAVMNNPVQFQNFGNDFSAAPAPTDVEVAGGSKEEDLFVVTLKNVTLKKGARMVVPVSSVDVGYTDVYSLDLPIVPPRDVRAQVGTNISSEDVKNLSVAKVVHKLRIANKTDVPFTTGPATIFRDEKILGQGLMTYASPGGSVDLVIGRAIDVKAKKKDVEISRTPSAVTLDKISYSEIALDGTITLQNLGAKAVKIEVRRHVFGKAADAKDGGRVEMLSLYDDEIETGDVAPETGWRAFNWPEWWSRLNGVGTATWTVELAPGDLKELHYSWRFFWR